MNLGGMISPGPLTNYSQSRTLIINIEAVGITRRGDPT
jgi:hypothetical protein